LLKSDTNTRPTYIWSAEINTKYFVEFSDSREINFAFPWQLQQLYITDSGTWLNNTIQYNTTQHNTTQHNTIQHNTTQYLAAFTWQHLKKTTDLVKGQRPYVTNTKLQPTRCNVSSIYLFLQTLYMFQAVPPPIIRSTQLYCERDGAKCQLFHGSSQHHYWLTIPELSISMYFNWLF
jgi:hypothetical protein